MSSFESRQVLAAGISPFEKTLPPNVLAACFTSVFLKAWGVSNVKFLSRSQERFDGTMFIEKKKRPIELFELGNVQIFSLPIEMIDEVTDSFLNPTQHGREKAPDTNLMILALGSPVFCQDIIRFAYVDRSGQIDPAINKFTNRIARAKPKEVIWTDTQTEDVLHEGDIITMFLDAKRMGVIPG